MNDPRAPQRHLRDVERYDANRTDYDDRHPAGPMQAADSRGDATPWNRDVDARFRGSRRYVDEARGYDYEMDYAGGAPDLGPESARDARRRSHFDENLSWDPDDRDALWRHGEYGSRLYGNVVGADTPIDTAAIPRYGPGGVERRAPRGYARSDERLHEVICARLSAESWLDLSDVEVHVKEAHVTLDGEVPDRFSKRAIGNIVDEAWGVKDVDNRIRVRAR